LLKSSISAILRILRKLKKFKIRLLKLRLSIMITIKEKVIMLYSGIHLIAFFIVKNKLKVIKKLLIIFIKNM